MPEDLECRGSAHCTSLTEPGNAETGSSTPQAEDNSQDPTMKEIGKPPQDRMTYQVSAIFRRMTSLPSSPNRNERCEASIHQSIGNKKEEEFDALKKKVDELEFRLDHTKNRLLDANYYITGLKERHGRDVSELQEQLGKYKSSLKSATSTIDSLERKVEDKEAQLSKVYSAAVSTWAQDVSRDMPDDVIRSTLSSFFQGNFFSWCADMCASEIQWNMSYENTLKRHNLVNGSIRYCSAPRHLLFDYSDTDGSSSLVLLQAALAKSLVDAFLTSPYFLLDDGIMFKRFEAMLSKKSPEAAINWRMNTVRNLEKTYPLRPARREALVHQFIATFGFLHEKLDESAYKDLADLFVRFSQIALKLWQTPTHVDILGMANMTNWPFRMNHPGAECEPAIASALGERLNGRPVGVVIRPCIVSYPIPEPGKEAPPVIWSKALVWVSGDEDPYDVED